MICPFCEKELTEVMIICEATIRGKFGAIHNNTIIEYADECEELTPTEYLCPECMQDITKHIKDSINPIEDNVFIDLEDDTRD